MNNYFRNIEAIGDIDAGCLWLYDGACYILVDDDNFRRMGDEWAHLFVSTPPPNDDCTGR